VFCFSPSSFSSTADPFSIAIFLLPTSPVLPLSLDRLFAPPDFSFPSPIFVQPSFPLRLHISVLLYLFQFSRSVYIFRFSFTYFGFPAPFTYFASPLPISVFPLHLHISVLLYLFRFSLSIYIFRFSFTYFGFPAPFTYFGSPLPILVFPFLGLLVPISKFPRAKNFRFC
jgi:hypothetical protein